MHNRLCHLPNGQVFTVTPVFGGVTFKSSEANGQHSVLPPGWTIVLNTKQSSKQQASEDPSQDEREQSARFTAPTLNDDYVYISSIVNPPSSEYKPVSSPTRQVAMMLWATLWWYFHEPQPDLHLQTDASASTPHGGKPKGDWRINIKRDGIFKKRTIIQKLERMGLIASEDSAVGDDVNDQEAWSHMFVSRRSFWQIDPRLFLFTLTPTNTPSTAVLSPFPSRRASPVRDSGHRPRTSDSSGQESTTMPHIQNEGPFTSASHLPTFFPPPPTQFTFTDGTRHPIRPKPPHQGEVFYTRYVPSVGQVLSFRVPNIPSPNPPNPQITPTHSHTSSTGSVEQPPQNQASDLDTLHKWMNDPRVNAAWGEGGPIEKQEGFLRSNLKNKHSFPVIGCWDGKPFGYFEIYWVKEDRLGRLIDGVTNYDRGIHLLVGEQEFRGSHRLAIWLSALVHYCWLADNRTETVMLEPRVDNAKVIGYLQQNGFYKEGEVTFPHKQSAVMKIKRDSWEAPAL
ncbi:hypothetical protein ASPWEDRAFT_25394 [Aspergillus wentii DTO 134E9]|uniref:Acyltransferase MbtK/IucB-like conserved domain-containing protein n=1 Tax=Aspergillus wentii DTO 134E9 TaxID=1073089 RepID=A0A1L9RXA2_ASPWE|nr:uncharacterized protein ASPWEDRAFT_25394 [Aspergillus wentii DTO 134E9]KAI9931751.1 hypothetical protein MW887_010330 [Aspergillus wentii]OJJ39570.1 hypothetical protein ASPWEDRAFT_25394 [Aspergillus wentii DTO 134E9]